MSAEVIVQGTLKPDGTLELDRILNLTPGRVRVTVAVETETARPDRFWAMMDQIWNTLTTAGHPPRSVEEVEAERRAFRDEWDERQNAIEETQRECEQRRLSSEESPR